MYCKNCGKQIAENAIFCVSCGKRVCPTNDGWTTKSVFLYAIFLAWELMNFALLTSSTSKFASEYFYPSFFWSEASRKNFEGTFDARGYDGLEFIFYAIILPLVLFYGVAFVKRIRAGHKTDRLKQQPNAETQSMLSENLIEDQTNE